MTSITADLSAVVGMIALVAFLLLGALGINRTRKIRIRGRKVTARLLNWNKPPGV
jgi:hypothetical protein